MSVWNVLFLKKLFPAQYSVVKYQLLSHFLRFREFIILIHYYNNTIIQNEKQVSYLYYKKNCV